MKVLIAVEDKYYGEAIAQFLCHYQKWGSDAEFRIIHVVEPLYLGGISGYPNEVLNSYVEERHRAGNNLVTNIGTKIKAAYASAKITEDVLDGHPKEVIIETAGDWSADVIVVGSHGRSGISRFLLGSVSMSVLSAAPCSVLIVKVPPEQMKAQELDKNSVCSAK